MSRPVKPTGTLVAVVAAAGIVQLPTAAIVVALPTIHAEFDTSLAELQWTVTAFYIPFAALLIAAGRLADVFGRRRMLLLGAALSKGVPSGKRVWRRAGEEYVRDR